MATNCYLCNAELPQPDQPRKRLRPKRCQSCNVKAAMKRRKDEPMRLLAHRFNNAMHRQGCEDPTLWSLANVKAVYDRFEGKSIISEEDRVELLCLFPYYSVRDAEATPETLLLVTSREAQSISRAKTKEERRMRFPENVREMMEGKK